MKRSFPYTAPSGSQGSGQQPTSQKPDYSAYGYGNTAHHISHDAQQAQWHQQWQQYYAQQAANASLQQGPQQAPQAAPYQQPYGGYTTTMATQGQSQPYVNGVYPQSTQQSQGYQPWTQPQPQGFARPAQQGSSPITFPGTAPPAQPFYGERQPSSGGHAAKRARTNYRSNTMYSGQASHFRPQPAGQAPGAPITHWNQGPSHTISGPTAPHMGGPSNMATPMASSPRTSGAQRAFSTGRPPRGHGAQGRQISASNAVGAPAKFSEPAGANAIGHMGGPGRPGFGHRGQAGGRGPPLQGHGGASGGHPKFGRQDINKSNGTKGRNSMSKGPALYRGTENNFDMQKAAIAQGRTSALSDQPVPPSSKRTFTDFKVKAIDIDAIDWHWYQSDDEDSTEENDAQDNDVTQEQSEAESADQSSTKKSKAGRRRSDSGKDASRLRVCFAANPPPPGAPTGPKALVKAKDSLPKAKDEDRVDAVGEEPSESTDEQGQKPIVEDETQAKEDDATDSNEPEWTAFSRGPPQSSTNRISISFASTRRRLVVDAEAIKQVVFHRAHSTVDITVDVVTAPGVKRRDQQDKKKGEEWVVIKGVLLEAREADTDNFGAVSRRVLESSWQEKRSSMWQEGEPQGEEANQDEEQDEQMDDHEESVTRSTKDNYKSLPPFYRLLPNHSGPEEERGHAPNVSEMVIHVTVDDSSLDAKWVKTGDVAEWLSVLPGIQPSLAADPVQSWVKKIHILDPEPPPTLADVYDVWVKTSNIGTALDRRQFLQEYKMDGADGISEAVARLFRGDRPVSTPAKKELGLMLQDAGSRSSFERSQSHLSLGFLAMSNLMRNYARQAGASEDELATQLQELLLSIPLHLVFRALDSLCKEVVDRQRSLQSKVRRSKLLQSSANGSDAGNTSRDTSICAQDDVSVSSKTPMTDTVQVSGDGETLGNDAFTERNGVGVADSSHTGGETILVEENKQQAGLSQDAFVPHTGTEDDRETDDRETSQTVSLMGTPVDGDPSETQQTVPSTAEDADHAPMKDT